VKQPSSPRITPGMAQRLEGNAAPVAAPGKSNALVFTLVGILVAAIAVLAYLVLTK
jgi:biopolymer transport protein ExbB/TolQ